MKKQTIFGIGFWVFMALTITLGIMITTTENSWIVFPYWICGLLTLFCGMFWGHEKELNNLSQD